MRLNSLKTMRAKYLLIVVLSLSLFACKEKQNSNSVKEENKEEVQTYFSITEYFVDQWNNRRGNPYTLLRIVTLNGKSDSAFVVMDSTLWFSLRAKFDAADISDPKFLGKYKDEIFNDETTETNHIYFEAKEPNLFMQKMDISVDMFNDKVKSVYVETREDKENYAHTQKLQYIPDRIFQFQESERSSDAPDKELRIEYRFDY